MNISSGTISVTDKVCFTNKFELHSLCNATFAKDVMCLVICMKSSYWRVGGYYSVLSNGLAS